jgi:short-subunit dehydrogenase
MQNKKIIIVGATSGIGRELAKLYAGTGALVGATGRRQDLLYSLQLEYPNDVITRCFDVRATDSITHIESLIQEMNGLDLLIYNSGYGETSQNLDWEIDKTTVDINVNGFIRIANFSFNYFVAQASGQLAAVSSLASVRGNPDAPAYSASKAFMSSYMEGLHIKAIKMKTAIYITDVQPGFVDTKMAKGQKRFWVAPVGKAAGQIFDAIERKKWRVYITRRWWLIAKFMQLIPDMIYRKIV